MSDDSIDDPRSRHLGCDPLDIRGVTRKYSQSKGSCDCTSVSVGNGIVGKTPRHQERGSSDACAVTRAHPQSEGGCHSTSLNATNGIAGETPRNQESTSPDICVLAESSPGDEFELRNVAPDVGDDIVSGIEQIEVEDIINL